MAQLYYRYSTMNAGKSAEVIRIAHNYEERSKRVLTLVPGIDDRYGEGMITSRIGIQRAATVVNEDTNILELFMREDAKEEISCVIIDECQFLKKHHVEELVEIVDSFREVSDYCPFGRIKKRVVFFMAQTFSTDVKVQKEEIDSNIWVDLNDVHNKCTYDNDLRVIKKARANISKLK